MHRTDTLSRFAVLLATALLFGAPLAGAQAIKKYVMPDGRVIYSDVPIEGAREAGQVAAPAEVDPQSRREAEAAARSDEQRAQEGLQRSEQANKRREAIRAAEQQLEQAQAKLANGKEPLPSERIGTAGGASRLNEAYFERQRANEQAVQAARRNLEAALAAP